MLVCANCRSEMYRIDNIYRCPGCGVEVIATEPEPEPFESAVYPWKPPHPWYSVPEPTKSLIESYGNAKHEPEDDK